MHKNTEKDMASKIANTPPMENLKPAFKFTHNLTNYSRFQNISVSNIITTRQHMNTIVDERINYIY